jgi:hypothetical protein
MGDFNAIIHNCYYQVGFAIIVFIIWALYKGGALRRMDFEESVFGPTTLIYLDYQGIYRKIGNTFKTVC